MPFPPLSCLRKKKKTKTTKPHLGASLQSGGRQRLCSCSTDPWLSLQNYGSGMRPPPNSLGPGMPGINMGPGAGRPWPNPSSANSVSINELITRLTGLHCSTDSTNSSDNIYTMINPVPPAGSRSNFPMGPGSDGPMGGMGGMEPHHMNGSLGERLPCNSPNNISGISNPPGTPRDDGELGGNFLHSFQNDNPHSSVSSPHGAARCSGLALTMALSLLQYSPSMTMSV
uniref:Uncharacterized protein n=1 Tax=Meleagris gallopavo TaxID=9103 RepID=G1NFV5_MELGA